MKVLFVLILSFALSSGIGKLVSGNWNYIFSGNLAMCLMLCLTAFGHYRYVAGMELMMPQGLPYKRELVIATGIAELLSGIALLFPKFRAIAGVLLILMFIAMLPANISAALRRVNMEKADYSGSGPAYLWFRIPMQILLIGWIWYFSVKR